MPCWTLFRKHGLPAQKLMGSDTLGVVLKEMGFQKREDFFVSIGAGKTNPQQVLTKVTAAGEPERHRGQADLADGRPAAAACRQNPSSGDLGIRVEGIDDVAIRIPSVLPSGARRRRGGLHLAWAEASRYTGATAPTSVRSRSNPERFTAVVWDRDSAAPFRVEIQIEAYDRSRLLEDISRTLTESGINILSARIQTTDENMVKDRFVFEVPKIDNLETILQRIRRIDTVYDVYRVTPG